MLISNKRKRGHWNLIKFIIDLPIYTYINTSINVLFIKIKVYNFASVELYIAHEQRE